MLVDATLGPAVAADGTDALGSADMIESSEFGSVMVARPTRVCTIKMCKR
jgi:hypothetical protein